MSKAAASTSSHKSSSPAAALVRIRNTLTFRLHPKQLIAFRSKATEILYRGAAGGGKPHPMRPPPADRPQNPPNATKTAPQHNKKNKNPTAIFYRFCFFIIFSPFTERKLALTIADRFPA